MYKCSIVNKKKKSKTDVKKLDEITLYKNEISRTNPRNPGKFIWLIIENNKKKEKIGIFLKSPDIKKNSLEFSLTKIISVIKNKIEAVNIWFTAAKRMVLPEKLPDEKIINKMKFIWTVVEKATTTLESIWINILRVVSNTPIIAKK